jgi:hypothetical protein
MAGDLSFFPFAGGGHRPAGRPRLHRAGAQRPRLRRQVLPRSAAAAALQVTDSLLCQCFLFDWRWRWANA